MNSVDKSAITAVILAGGQSRRLGRDKAVEPFAGEPLIRRVIRRASEAVSASEVVVVVADPSRAAELPLEPEHLTAVDVFPDCGSLGGIYTTIEERLEDLARRGILIRSDEARKTLKEVERRPGALQRFLDEREE